MTQMTIMRRFCGLIILLLVGVGGLALGQSPAPTTPPSSGVELRAGLASVVITPSEPMWMAGYAARTERSQGALHDLQAKALALEDKEGDRIVIVSCDLLGFPRDLAARIAERAEDEFQLRREQLLLNASHTHTGPVVEGSLVGAYELTPEDQARIRAYTQRLEDSIVGVIGRALAGLAPARLSFGNGLAGFAMNRRVPTPKGIVGGTYPEGVVDRDVPVLRIDTPEGKLRGVVFGYACHNTTLTAQFLQFSGDYSGFASLAIEKDHPGATALFLAGCGADVNPAPRSRLDLAEDHGQELAQAVESVLSGQRTPVKGRIRTAYDLAALPFASPPSREEFLARSKAENSYLRRHAERMLARLESNGRLSREYPCPVQVVRIGEDFTLVAIGGEVATDYALRLKKELPGRVWVAGYSNDVFGYVPSARMFPEGGYEVNESMIYYDHPGPFIPEIEDIIVRRINKLIEQTRRAPAGPAKR